MGTPVQITLIGHQYGSTGEETVNKTTATAEYYEKNGTLYLLYEEYPECNETVAETQKPNRDTAKIPKTNGAVVHNRIKYKDNLLEVTRSGAINTRMVFESGKEHMTDYATPYGCLRLGILTHSLEVIPPIHNKKHLVSPTAPTAPKPDAIPQDKEDECLHYNLYPQLKTFANRQCITSERGKAQGEKWQMFALASITGHVNEMVIRTSYSLTAEGQPVSDCKLEIVISFERM